MRYSAVFSGIPLLISAVDEHASFQSIRGVQHAMPWISDDLVVGCIMLMFLLLFAFGMPQSLLLDAAFRVDFACPTTDLRYIACAYPWPAGKQ